MDLKVNCKLGVGDVLVQVRGITGTIDGVFINHFAEFTKIFYRIDIQGGWRVLAESDLFPSDGLIEVSPHYFQD